MGPILAVGGAHINDVVHDEYGAVGRVVGEDAQVIHHVVAPDNVGILGAGFDRRRWTLGRLAAVQHDIFDDVFGLVLEWAVVAIGHAVEVEAENFAAAGDQVNAIALDGWRGEQPEVFPVVDFAGGQLGHDQLPEEFAGLLVEAHQDAAVPLVARVARVFVVRADEHLAGGDGHVAIALGTDLNGPLEVLNLFGVHLFGALLELDFANDGGQALGRGIHIAHLAPAPLGPILGGAQAEGPGSKKERQPKRRGSFILNLHLLPKSGEFGVTVTLSI